MDSDPVLARHPPKVPDQGQHRDVLSLTTFSKLILSTTIQNATLNIRAVSIIMLDVITLRFEF